MFSGWNFVCNMLPLDFTFATVCDIFLYDSWSIYEVWRLWIRCEVEVRGVITTITVKLSLSTIPVSFGAKHEFYCWIFNYSNRSNCFQVIQIQ